jgi:Bacterial Ig-like domain
MTMLQAIAACLPAADPRSIREIDQEILDELEFHLAARTQEYIDEGMPADEAHAAALERFGDYVSIRRTCRRTLLGERVMVQRLQMVLTMLLLLAVVVIGYQTYLAQRENQAALANMAQTLSTLASSRDADAASATLGAPPEWAADQPRVVETFPTHGAMDVDPATSEIRVTFDKEMCDGCWSWVRSSGEAFPGSTGDAHYLEDMKTCVMPVKLEPGTKYVVWFNTANYQNFKDREGRPAVPTLLSFTTRE